MTSGMLTPWGVAEIKEQLAEGIFQVKTAQHGGILIERAIAPTLLSEPARKIGQAWEDFLAFEQENDMMVVLYEHPEFFYPRVEEAWTEKFAEDSLRAHHPEYFGD